MKCTLFYEDIPYVSLNLIITPYSCEVTSAFILKELPENLKFLYSPDGDIDLGDFSAYLSARISYTVKQMRETDLWQFLNLCHQTEKILPYFLVSFLWHLETGDGISIYPNQTEYLYFADKHPIFQHVYRISAKENYNL